jgi:hypothetical protein
MRTPADWEALYHQLGQIISDEPKIPTGENRGTSEILRWLGRAETLIKEVSGVVDSHKVTMLRERMLIAKLTDPESEMQQIRALLYTALAKAEMNAPTAAKGSFIPAGNAFDALTAIAGVLRECRGSVLVVDPYMDAVVLTDFLPMVSEGIPLRLLASNKQANAGLPEAVNRWKDQYAQVRPMQLRLASPKLLHDRLIMDDLSVWSLSQSFNAIAKRSPAMVQRVSAEISASKREAFKDMWDNASPV